MLAGYCGYLQVDAAPAYDDVFAQYPEIVEVGCTAHARRYFKEALPTAAETYAQALASMGSSTGSSGRPGTGSSMRPLDSGFGRSRLGRCWRNCKRTCKSSRRRRYRRARSVRPSANALRNWVALTRYAEDERLKIDNTGA